MEPAEALAHATEDLLRLMRAGEVGSDEEVISVLNEVANKLEQIVAAFRLKTPLPGHEALLIQIKKLCPENISSNRMSSQGEDAANQETICI